MTAILPLLAGLPIVAAAADGGDDHGRATGSTGPAKKSPGAVGGPYLMLSAVLLGVGIGYALDRHYLTTPRWTAGLGLLGIAVGLYHAVREASR
jgi:uncharacterized membrane protein